MAQRRKISPSPSTPTPSATSSWKDHPLVVASAAVAGTIALGVLLVTEVILPTQTAALANQVTALSAEASSLRESKVDANKKLEHLQSQVADLDRKLSDAQHSNLFSFGNPYPVGLGQVRVGDPISSVAAVYPENAINKNENSYWSVNDQHKLFNNITYYFDEKVPKSPITHILFSIVYPVTADDAFLQGKLVEALGTPKQEHKKGFFSWSTQAKAVVYKYSSNSFILMDKNHSLGMWPKE
jgi:hypothetical protein